MTKKTPEDNDLDVVLQKLCDKISLFIEEGKSHGILKLNNERRQQIKYSFEEVDSILKWKSTSSDEIIKETWFEAVRIIDWKIKEIKEYTDAHQKFKLEGFDSNASNVLDRFITNIAFKFLETQEISEREDFKNELISKIKKYPNNEIPKRYTIKTELAGIIPSSIPFKFNINHTNYTLRRILVEDFPTELPYWTNKHSIYNEIPSAILEISTLVKFPSEISEIVQQARMILLLFKPASISSISTTFESDCFWDTYSGSTYSSIFSKGTVFITEHIKDEEKNLFEIFFITMSKIIQKGGHHFQTKDFGTIGIAYQRYTDSLFISSVPIERRIADAVMGLESLFLTENMEVSYRLRIRAAKVLGILGYNPYEIKNIVNDVYSIRSSFVHGDKIDAKGKKRIEDKYNGFRELHKLLLNLLRIAIVIYLILDLEKKDFIKLIDDSFIDKLKADELEEKLKIVSPFVSQAKVNSSDLI